MPTAQADEKTAEKKEPSTEKSAERMPPGKRRRLIVGGVIAAVLVAVGAVGFWLYWRHYEDTDDAFIEGHVITISPKIAGHIERVLVDDNQDVAKGELLVEVDARDFEARVAQARAQVAAAESRLAQAKAQIERAKAEVDQGVAEVAAAEAEAERAKTDWERYRSAPEVVTKQATDTAQATAKSTAAQLIAARQRLTASRTQVPVAEAELASATADRERTAALLREAELQLSYTKVTAPEAGRVTRKAAENGQYVQPGEALMAIVQPDVWVIANFRETQLTYMEPGQPVDVEVDAYPERKLKAHVDSIQKGSGARFSLLPPENATGNYVKVVQRVPVKIVFDEPLEDLRRLGVGMSVVPKVKVR